MSFTHLTPNLTSASWSWPSPWKTSVLSPIFSPIFRAGYRPFFSGCPKIMSQGVGIRVKQGLKEYLFSILCESNKCFLYMPNLERKFLIQDFSLFKSQLSGKYWADLGFFFFFSDLGLNPDSHLLAVWLCDNCLTSPSLT